MKEIEISEIQIDGEPFFFRNASSDSYLLERNMNPKTREYFLPEWISPEVILDIGANIGVITRLMAHIYPQATIYAFEPEQSNFELLKRNTEKFPNIKIFNFGLSDQTVLTWIKKSDVDVNFGGFSLFEAGSGDPHAPVEIRNATHVMEELGITRADLIKIDTEGSETKILSTLGEKFLSQSDIICGELHGQDDFYCLDMLSNWFEIGMQKDVEQRAFGFLALNRDRKIKERFYGASKAG